MPPLAHLAGRNQYAPQKIGRSNIRKLTPIVKVAEMACIMSWPR